MTDLELTSTCAEAMGYQPRFGFAQYDLETGKAIGDQLIFCDQTIYRPLHDGAQVMELVKRFSVQIGGKEGDWFCWISDVDGSEVEGGEDLNRSIVECVAKMHLAKRSDSAPEKD